MSTLPLTINGNRARGWALWVVPAVALAALVGWETDWGRQLVRMPSAPPPVESKPVTAAALPEYRIEGGLPAHAEMVARTLFNATRRPAPVLASDGPHRLNPGRFQLVGTTVTAERNVAFLKEVAGGKSRVVRQGDEIDGVYVASVTPDRVKLTLGDESEELILKVAQGPKTTLAAAPPPPGAPAVAAPAAAAGAARGAQARAQAAAAPNAAEVRPQDARQARRAARAAQEAAAMSGQGSDTSAQGARKRNR
ncbi:MAG: hypothetical protein E6H60_07655 [Betaproteobacteria bacterium]|nr:MAG: hypothetical protein E6H60_07655 [Betaproteobacteria bacterium]TMI03904.1 MAG: hypothetical protein E6H46_08100 [Betaproteobacteria bacterium]